MSTCCNDPHQGEAALWELHLSFSTCYWHSLKNNFARELSLCEYIPSEQAYYQP